MTEVQILKKYEAGITEVIYPYSPRWTGIFYETTSERAAETHFSENGFYRNLVVREVE